MDEKRFQKMLSELHDLNSQYEKLMKADSIGENEKDKAIIKDAFHKNSFLFLQFSKIALNLIIYLINR